MKTDTIFYRLFECFPSILFELVNKPAREANAYQFSSVEIKQLSFRLDGVFLPRVPSLDKPIYFAEVQFQRDDDFYSRFFSQLFLYLDKTELSNDWRGVVIYPNIRIESSNTRRYKELLTPERVTRIYLDELGDISELSIGLATVKLVMVEEDTAIETGRELLQRTRNQITDPKQLKDVLELIETILLYKLPRYNYKEIEAMFNLSDLKQTRVYQEAKLEGKQEGLLEGKQEGLLEGKLESVAGFLELGLTVEQIAKALNLSVEQVESVIPKQ